MYTAIDSSLNETNSEVRHSVLRTKTNSSWKLSVKQGFMIHLCGSCYFIARNWISIKSEVICKSAWNLKLRVSLKPHGCDSKFVLIDSGTDFTTYSTHKPSKWCGWCTWLSYALEYATYSIHNFSHAISYIQWFSVTF